MFEVYWRGEEKETENASRVLSESEKRTGSRTKTEASKETKEWCASEGIRREVKKTGGSEGLTRGHM